VALGQSTRFQMVRLGHAHSKVEQYSCSSMCRSAAATSSIAESKACTLLVVQSVLLAIRLSHGAILHMFADGDHNPRVLEVSDV
jgi:hypothetical protein